MSVLAVGLSSGDGAGYIRAAQSLCRQGHVVAERLRWDGGELSYWAHPGQQAAGHCVVRTATGMACCVGPLWYRGRFGADALAALLAEVYAAGRYDEAALRGNFALFLQSGDHVWLLNDGMGLVHIHAAGDGCFYSTSWLAACAYLGQVELDDASAIEYVLLGAAHSRHSVVRGVGLLPIGSGMDLQRRQAWARFPGGLAPAAAQFDSPGTAVEAVAEHLRTVSRDIAVAFPGRINAALSGGFDSRLIVAGLLAVGVAPRLFVYGAADSVDVAVARTVADAAGLALDIVDKAAISQDLPLPDIEALERSALFFDGLPVDGIDDPGADRQTRLQQSAGGAISLNGGGGEVFRNFFHLRDRSFTAGDIVRTFYRGFSPAVFRRATGLFDYEARLAASMLEALGLHGVERTRLTRPQVELLYPLFRCHYWMGANNSVAVRHGYFMTPLVDPYLVCLAHRLPLSWKNAGAFESRLIDALHSRIAAQPSEYGFSFAAGPNWAMRTRERLTRARPVWLRPLINATRRRMQHAHIDPGLLRRYRQLLPGEWCMDPLLDLGKLVDAGALGRALAIEVAWRRLF